MTEQNFEPISEANLSAVSGGTDDQPDPSNWPHRHCPNCGSTNIKVSARVIGIPTEQKCQDCGTVWAVIGADEFA